MIRADQFCVADALGDAFVREIPPYQRLYAWVEEQALQVFEDLRDAIRSGTEEPCFLGSVVLIKLSGQPISQSSMTERRSHGIVAEMMEQKSA